MAACAVAFNSFSDPRLCGIGCYTALHRNSKYLHFGTVLDHYFDKKELFLCISLVVSYSHFLVSWFNIPCNLVKLMQKYR